MPAPGPETGLLYHLPMFAPLPLAVTDLIAAEVEPRQFPAGAVVMREGEPGDRFYLITDGGRGGERARRGQAVPPAGGLLRRNRAASRHPADSDHHRGTITAYAHSYPGRVPHRRLRQQHEHGSS
jgi:hypothetical protein